MRRRKDDGISLLNVLVVVAAGAGLVHVMLDEQDAALTRTVRSRDAVQAMALAESGVTSVVVALRRDFRDSPQTDHLAEAWAKAAQKEIQLDFGSFKVMVTDARGKLNVNELKAVNLSAQRAFAALLIALDLPEALLSRIMQIVSRHGPFSSLKAIEAHGLSAEDLDRLTPHLVALPDGGGVNLNAATEPVMAAIFENATVARALVARRAPKGYLEQSDLAPLGVTLPPLGVFTSNAFDVVVRTEVGTARAVQTRRLLRDGQTGRVRTIPIID
ncbi:MAG: hypothetical protein AAGH68_02495 [Pseudomonadota bacterium]